jgi:hypothetical protein
MRSRTSSKIQASEKLERASSRAIVLRHRQTFWFSLEGEMAKWAGDRPAYVGAERIVQSISPTPDKRRDNHFFRLWDASFAMVMSAPKML